MGYVLNSDTFAGSSLLYQPGDTWIRFGRHVMGEIACQRNRGQQLREQTPVFVVQVSADGGPANATRTAVGPKVKAVTLKWQAALLFGGQLLLVGGGVVAQVQQAAGASADNARHAQVLEAKYFAGMTQAESGLQEYIDTGDIDNPGHLQRRFDCGCRRRRCPQAGPHGWASAALLGADVRRVGSLAGICPPLSGLA